MRGKLHLMDNSAGRCVNPSTDDTTAVGAGSEHSIRFLCFFGMGLIALMILKM